MIPVLKEKIAVKQQFFPVRTTSNKKFLEVPRISVCGNPRVVFGPAFHASGCRHHAFSPQLRFQPGTSPQNCQRQFCAYNPLGVGSACAGLGASVHACAFLEPDRVISRDWFQIRKAGALLLERRSLETTPSGNWHGRRSKRRKKSTRYVFAFHGIAVYFRMCH
jgi:hypothetical protein